MGGKERAKMNIVKTVKKSLLKASLLLSSAICCYLPTYCDVFDTAELGISSLQTKLTSLAFKLFPLAIVIDIVVIFFTHDQRKMELEIKILVGLCLCLVLLLFVEADMLVPTIRGLLGM